VAFRGAAPPKPSRDVEHRSVVAGGQRDWEVEELRRREEGRQTIAPDKKHYGPEVKVPDPSTAYSRRGKQITHWQGRPLTWATAGQGHRWLLDVTGWARVQVSGATPHGGGWEAEPPASLRQRL